MAATGDCAYTTSIALRRLVDERFCSSVTDQALQLLGDLAFERGEFGEAQAPLVVAAGCASE